MGSGENNRGVGDCTQCSEWSDGKGSKACFKCGSLQQRLAAVHRDTPRFFTLGDMIENVRSDNVTMGLVDACRKLEPRDGIMYLRYKLFRDSITEMAQDYNLTYQRIWQILGKAKHDIAEIAGVSTSTAI